MIDLREYGGFIRDEVKAENEKQENHKFSVKSVNKRTALIKWSYLSDLGETNDCFKIATDLSGCDDEDYIVSRDPNGNMIDAVSIEPATRFSAEITPERAIRWAVRSIVRFANSRY